MGRLWGVVCALLACAASIAAPQTQEAVVAQLAAKARQMGFDVPKYVAMLDATADKLIDRNPNLGSDYPIWVLPSSAYPEMYVRDSFWTLSGYGKGDFLRTFVDIFSRNSRAAAWNPPLEGQVPT